MSPCACTDVKVLYAARMAAEHRENLHADRSHPGESVVVWRDQFDELRQCYHTVIGAGNPYARGIRHVGISTLNTLEMPTEQQSGFTCVIKRGFRTHEEQHDYSRQLAEYVFVPWLLTVLHHAKPAERIEIVHGVENQMSRTEAVALQYIRREVLDKLDESLSPAVLMQ